MGGIFLGFLCAVLLIVVLGRTRSSQPPSGALVLAGVGVLLWPIALAMLLGVILAFGVANLFVLAQTSGRSGQAVSMGDLRGLLLSSLGLVLLELGGLAALRSWLIAAFG